MGSRRSARECALMVLYQIDVSGLSPESALERFFATYDSGEPLDPPPPFALERDADAIGQLDPEARAYAEVLVRGVVASKDDLDAQIQKVSQNWRLDRMALVDRNILRLGAYEITARTEDVPRKVAINEALEIAKRFGTAESTAFINGLLDRVGR